MSKLPNIFLSTYHPNEKKARMTHEYIYLLLYGYLERDIIGKINHLKLVDTIKVNC